MALLLEYRQGDVPKYADMAESAAINSERNHDWFHAHYYWHLKARWHQLAKEPDEERESKIRAAETYVRLAEDTVVSKRGYGLAASYIMEAIGDYQRVGTTKQRREELYRILIDYQAASVQELKPTGSSVDISEGVQKVIAQISGKSLHEALYNMVMFSSPPKVSDLRLQVEQFRAIAPLHYLFASVMLNKNGKVIAKRPSSSSSESDDKEAVIKAEMLRNAIVQRMIVANMLILPALNQIYFEHQVRLSDFQSL